MAMGLMQRISALVQAWISRLVGKAEDPEVTLDYAYERQRELLRDVKRGVADVVTARNRIELQADRLRQSTAKLEAQAREALAAGREDLARTALERKALAEQEERALANQLVGLSAQQEKLVAAERRMAAKVEAFRAQKEVIKAEYSAAEAQVKIGEAATGIGEEMADTALAIERAREKTDQMQARSAAIDELVEVGTLEELTAGESHLDRELAAIAAKTNVDAELDRLRRELGAPATTKEVEA
jgi:phage shock protein A